MAEKAVGSNGTIIPFVTSDNSRRDNEICWLLDVRSLTNPPDLVISSPKTKGSVIPQAEWSPTGQNQYKYTVHSCGLACEEMGPYLPCKA